MLGFDEWYLTLDGENMRDMAENLRGSKEHFSNVFKDVRQFLAKKLDNRAGNENFVICGSVASGH